MSGILGFFIIALITFRLTYGGWPPHEGDFTQWLKTDPKAMISFVESLLAGMIWSAIARKLGPWNGVFENREGVELVRRGLKLHEQGRLEEAVEKFKSAIALFHGPANHGAAADSHACLAKAYFDMTDLDSAENHIKIARVLYQERRRDKKAVSSLETLQQLISERRRDSSTAQTYHDTHYPLSFVVPADWSKQKLVPGFVKTGGRIAISHKSHAATFNVSVGKLDLPESSLPEVRAVLAKDFLQTLSHRCSDVDIQLSMVVAGEKNAVVGECDSTDMIGARQRQRRNGFLSIVHRDIEYTIQWSAEAHLLSQTREVIGSFKFEDISLTAPAPATSATITPSADWSVHVRRFLVTHEVRELDAAWTSFVANRDANPQLQQSVLGMIERLRVSEHTDLIDAERLAKEAALLLQPENCGTQSQSLQLVALNTRIRVGQSSKQVRTDLQDAVIASVLDACRESADICRQLGDAFAEAEFLTRSGNGYFSYGNLLEARAHFEKAVVIWRSLLEKDTSVVEIRLIRGLRHLADVWRDADAAKALDLYSEAIKLGELVSDKRELAFCFYNLSNLHIRQENQAAAIDCLERCCHLLRAAIDAGHLHLTEDPFSPPLGSILVEAQKLLRKLQRDSSADESAW